MPQLTIVYWRDIPAQVIAAKQEARSGSTATGKKRVRREQVKKPLDARFEQAIDRAAMKGKESSTDDYLAQWRKVNLGECGDDLAAVVAAKKAELEAEYDTARLDALVANGGNEAE